MPYGILHHVVMPATRPSRPVDDGMTAMSTFALAERVPRRKHMHPTSDSPPVYLDFETYSRLSLPEVGTSAYAEDATTCVLCLAWAIGEGTPQLWTPLDEDDARIPQELAEALAADSVRVCAHNFGFERAIWTRHVVIDLGWPEIPLDSWSCTAFRCRLARIPASLDEAAKVLGLSQQKDPAGRKLLQLIAKMADPYIEMTSEQWAQLHAYCAQDLRALRALDQALPQTPDEWQAIFELDARMNDRGVPVDLATVERLITVRNHENARLAAEFLSSPAMASSEHHDRSPSWSPD
jgi:DNA polymerase